MLTDLRAATTIIPCACVTHMWWTQRIPWGFACREVSLDWLTWWISYTISTHSHCIAGTWTHHSCVVLRCKGVIYVLLIVWSLASYRHSKAMCWRLENLWSHLVVPYHWRVFWTLWIVNIWSSSSVFNTVSKSFPVNNQITIASTILCQLPENDVLRDSAKWIMLSEEGSFKQYLTSFFKRAFP